MIRDILLAADDVLQISSAVNYMNRYVHLNDSILNEIARSTDPRLETARDILERVHRRDLYRFADQVSMLMQVIIPSDLMQTLKESDFSAGSLN
jgi:predicted DNA-binding protein YlxM (UPF0122 family)